MAKQSPAAKGIWAKLWARMEKAVPMDKPEPKIAKTVKAKKAR